MNTLADHLQKRRLDLGLQWKAVAHQIGVDATTLTNWTMGRTQPDLRYLPAGRHRLAWIRSAALARSMGEALIRHRRLLGRSQKELAAVLRVDPSTLARWERRERVPAGEYAERVRAVLFSPT